MQEAGSPLKFLNGRQYSASVIHLDHYEAALQASEGVRGNYEEAQRGDNAVSGDAQRHQSSRCSSSCSLRSARPSQWPPNLWKEESSPKMAWSRRGEPILHGWQWMSCLTRAVLRAVTGLFALRELHWKSRGWKIIQRSFEEPWMLPERPEDALTAQWRIMEETQETRAGYLNSKKSLIIFSSL